ncbi:MAG: hypothetical protein ABIP94_17515 [Planctomycetota bacterium]
MFSSPNGPSAAAVRIPIATLPQLELHRRWHRGGLVVSHDLKSLRDGVVFCDIVSRVESHRTRRRSGVG